MNVDRFVHFMTDICKLSILTTDEELQLARKFQNGDIHSGNELIRHNLRILTRLARKYRRPGVELEDLFQEGGLGFMWALRKYDPGRGYRFTTYAMWWADQYMSRYSRQYRLRPGTEELTEGVAIDVNDPEIQYMDAEFKLCIQKLISELPDRERMAVWSTFWIDGSTIRSIGKREGVSGERIRQLRERGLERLGKRMKGWRHEGC